MSIHEIVARLMTAAPPALTSDVGAIVELVLTVVGGLGIFLLGMKNMSEGVQAIAGQTMRRMIAAVTDNRLLGVGVGTFVTCLVQSSSITTVLVVGFVNAGLMALHQAIGVIMGANIGTTITGWILVLKIGKYGLPILGAAAFIYLFSRRDRVHYIAMAVMGVGMVFFGLELMKNGFKPMKDLPTFQEAFEWFRADSYFGVLKCALVGCVLTFIVQSSSATLGITIGLAATGAIPFETAAALVLGENIGTTITAWLASIGATTNAKRAAYAHVLFNLIGVLWITALFAFYIRLIGWWVTREMGSSPIGLELSSFEDPKDYEQIITFGIASVHTGFNVTNTLLFLPFVRVFARMLERLVPAKKVREQAHLTTLDMRMLDTPAIAIEQSRAEIIKMGTGVMKMMRWSRRIVFQAEPREALVQKTFHREEVLDIVEREVVAFHTDLLSSSMPQTVAAEARLQLRIADELESSSDAIIAIVKSYLKLRQSGHDLSPKIREDLESLHRQVSDYIQIIVEAYAYNRKEILSRAHSDGKAITHHVKEIRRAHLEKLSVEPLDPLVSLSFTTMLANYRRLRDHGLNIAEAVAGEK
ncbi:MAG: Na/Pi cotransporter family protein [Phycisphaerales bacterium]